MFDNLGESFSLSNEVQPGIYQTESDSLNGMVGRSYAVSITLPNGNQYRSESERLKPVAAVDDLDWQLVLGGFQNLAIALELLVTYSDPPGQGDFYRWKFYSNGNSVKSPKIVLADDRLLNGYQTSFAVSLAELPFNAVVRVDQLSLTQAAHNYLQQLKSQTEDLGKTFGVSPSPVNGNVISLTKPSEAVLGYFGASAIQSKQIAVTP